MSSLVYFSSTSENTHRFIKKLCLPATRISLSVQKKLKMHTPYILVLPSYSSKLKNIAIPKQVINFLKIVSNQFFLRGVIGSGNKNFGADFCIASNFISKKYHVPILYKFELLGNPADVIRVKNTINKFWKKQNLEKQNKNA
ncbi:NrdI family ribonucleotide reduction protein [Wigglesworthia glossinidia endosymbiont of Glossina morsitans morsitans (Yale colony)]|uniref:Protein NrdI n=1 Tax=Wigglesworthia glossinidia endosymbiont of Glossina morsitans morsitans (Yale colony) TaxID=1142511 RepID=H6Q5J7_WIGGL|nr:class Ib ribonucleoside-diphosphate reductase assembly flavoprotein NrdI [Wigglesworthia glossinidia]AFA41480.1 NrdI family ribonucleotide reduction protein [Wigglesworthia glossinidia endosymbiont of Glossina morsitans morsitans (Yale colony)]